MNEKIPLPLGHMPKTWLLGKEAGEQKAYNEILDDLKHLKGKNIHPYCFLLGMFIDKKIEKYNKKVKNKK